MRLLRNINKQKRRKGSYPSGVFYGELNLVNSRNHNEETYFFL